MSNKTIRRLALWPWAIGAASYLAGAVVSIHYHNHLVDMLISSSEGFWGSVLYVLAWLGAAIVLLLGTIIFSIIVVTILAGVFQSWIAEQVFEQYNVLPKTIVPDFRGLLKELMRNIKAEILKAIWMVPLALTLIALGFIPALTIPVFILGSWLLAYQFVDVGLDLLHLPASRRLLFSLRHVVSVTIFGITLAIVWPVAGFLLPPVAAAGAAWLLATGNYPLVEENKLGDTTNEQR
jgi:uncharacterized protein involved in cysteine biosynthesis